MGKGGKISKTNVNKIITDQRLQKAVRHTTLLLAKAEYGDPLEKMVTMEKDLTKSPDAVSLQVKDLLVFYGQLTDYINGKDREEPYPASVVKIGKALLDRVTCAVIKGLYLAGMKVKPRILIAEYEKWYLEGVADYLILKGYECGILKEVTGTNILEAVLSPNFEFDILMMCIMMPAGSEELKKELREELKGKLKRKVTEEECYTGLTVIRKIREKKPDLPSIVITVVDDPEILKEIRDMGCRVLGKEESGLDEILKAVQEAEDKLCAK